MLGIVACIFSATSQAQIHFVPGPYGGTKMITPWGDYVAVEFGNSLWIGTEGEWVNLKSKAILEQNGMKEGAVQGQSKNDHYYFLKDAVSVQVSGVRLQQLTTGVMFGATSMPGMPRPKKPSDAEYVSMFWTPSKSVTVRGILKIAEKSNMLAFQYMML